MELVPKLKAGDACVFDYPREFTTLPDYTEHAGQGVVIVRELIDGIEYDGPYLDDDGQQEREFMYLVRADDGWTGHAFESELQPVKAAVRS